MYLSWRHYFILVHVFTDTVPSVCAHSLPCIDTWRFFVTFTLNLVHQATFRYVRFVETLLCNRSSVHRYPYPPSAPTISPVLIRRDSLLTPAANLVYQATFQHVPFVEALFYECPLSASAVPLVLSLDDSFVTFNSNLVYPLTPRYDVFFVAALFYTNLYMYQYRSLCLSPLSAPTQSPLY